MKLSVYYREIKKENKTFGFISYINPVGKKYDVKCTKEAILMGKKTGSGYYTIDVDKSALSLQNYGRESIDKYHTYGCLWIRENATIVRDVEKEKHIAEMKKEALERALDETEEGLPF